MHLMITFFRFKLDIFILKKIELIWIFEWNIKIIFFFISQYSAYIINFKSKIIFTHSLIKLLISLMIKIIWIFNTNENQLKLNNIFSE